MVDTHGIQVVAGAKGCLGKKGSTLSCEMVRVAHDEAFCLLFQRSKKSVQYIFVSK